MKKIPFSWWAVVEVVENLRINKMRRESDGCYTISNR
jgi:hypothetical protein